MITSVQLQKLDALYANGQVEGISADRLESFSEEEVDLLIQECEEVPPYTFLPETVWYSTLLSIRILSASVISPWEYLSIMS